MSRSIQVQDAFLVDSADRPIAAPAVGEMVFLHVDWLTSGLTSNDSYVVGFSVDGVTLDSSTITGQAGNNLSYAWYRGGWYASPASHSVSITVDPSHSVSGADESQATTTLAFTPQAPTSLPAKFLDPMGSVNSNWTIVNYLDVNPLDTAYNDYKGGSYTYDGHTGMDLTLANFAGMDAGYPVYAAASGTVSQVVDGNFDRDTDVSGNPANFVIVDHGNGWQTIYYHFMSGSIAVKVGQQVSAGQMIGLVGSSGSSTDPHLHFEVQHDGDPVETNDAALSYWVTPFAYAGDVPAYSLDAGITSSDPSADLKERPVDVSTFPTSSTGTSVWYWYRLSDLHPTDTVLVRWYRPDGTLATTYNYTPSGSERDGLYEWVLPSSTWSTATGAWHAAVSVDGVEMGREAFTVTSGAGLPAIRVTQGSTAGTYILDNRTTPVDFGSSALSSSPSVLTFTVQDVGLAPLSMSSLALPTGFTLLGSLAPTVAPGSTTTFAVQMNTTAAGPQFGRLTFSTNVPGEPTFGFNLSGTVTGSAQAGTPTVTFGDPAAVFDPRVGPVAVDPDLAVTLGFRGIFLDGLLTAGLVSGGTTADHLAIANQGVGAGQVGLVGSNVLYGGTVVGTFVGGDGLAPLVVSFNASANLAAVGAVARDVVFRSDLPISTAPRYVRFTLTDSLGQSSEAAVKKIDLDPGIPAASLSPSALHLVQGGTGSIVVTLGAQPSSDVVITLVPGAGLSLGVTTLTFTPTDWLTPRSVGLTAKAGYGGTVATIAAMVAAGSDPTFVGIAIAPATVQITRATALVVLTQPPGSVVLGAPFGLTVEATDAFGQLDPTFNGRVTIAIGANPSGGSLGGVVSANAVGGLATFSGLTLNEVGLGYTLSATAAGLSSTTTGAVNVTQATLAVSLAANPASLMFGQLETLTATLAAVAGTTPTGTVTFKDGSTVLGVATLVNSGGLAVATFKTTGLGVGGHSIVAFYGGDANFAAGASAAIPVVVVPASTITGTVFDDLNGDGVLSPGEPGIAGRTVYIDLKKDGRLDPGDPTAVTNASGGYGFATAPGTYTVRLVPDPGDLDDLAAGLARSATVVNGQPAAQASFGVVPTSSVLPLNFVANPFGAHNPDLATAEMTGLYRLILNRAPDPGGLAAGIGQLKSGKTIAEIASGMMLSVEYETDLILADYRNYLGRTPSAGDLASGVATMQRGATPEQMASFFLATPEFSIYHPQNADFVQAAYADLLGRQAAPAEQAAVVGLIASGTSRATIITDLLYSRESILRAVGGFYLTFLDRAPDAGGQNNAVQGIQGGTLTFELVAAYLVGDEYAARARRTVG